MRIHDISIAITPDMVSWDDGPGPVVDRYLRIEDGELVNNTRVLLDLHAGTHVDAPYHFLADGGRIDAVDLERLCGPCYVAQTTAPVIDAEVLEAMRLPQVERILFKTNNAGLYARRSFAREYVALDLSGAVWLVRRGIKAVGIDYLSIERFEGMDGSVHRALLNNDVAILEALDLANVPVGDYFLVALPIKVADAEAAPVRAVLLEGALA
jgi:arylformamidase